LLLLAFDKSGGLAVPEERAVLAPEETGHVSRQIRGTDMAALYFMSGSGTTARHLSPKNSLHLKILGLIHHTIEAFDLIGSKMLKTGAAILYRSGRQEYCTSFDA
jgi:hypothetical protein